MILITYTCEIESYDFQLKKIVMIALLRFVTRYNVI